LFTRFELEPFLLEFRGGGRIQDRAEDWSAHSESRW
jgi:hypothetical protein